MIRLRKNTLSAPLFKDRGLSFFYTPSISLCVYTTWLDGCLSLTTLHHMPFESVVMMGSEIFRILDRKKGDHLK